MEPIVNDSTPKGLPVDTCCGNIDMDRLDMAIAEAGIGGDPNARYTCQCGRRGSLGVSILGAPMDLKVKALILAGWDGSSGCAGKVPSAVAEFARITASGWPMHPVEDAT